MDFRCQFSGSGWKPTHTNVGLVSRFTPPVVGVVGAGLGFQKKKTKEKRKNKIKSNVVMPRQGVGIEMKCV